MFFLVQHIVFLGELVMLSERIKFFSIVLQRNLHWQAQVDYVVAKGIPHLGALRRFAYAGTGCVFKFLLLLCYLATNQEVQRLAYRLEQFHRLCWLLIAAACRAMNAQVLAVLCGLPPASVVLSEGLVRLFYLLVTKGKLSVRCG
eukprot:TRINITY_DN1414_c0_g1_i3.p1 TRINITY_DN1414_c0_g1~~TRINITY_DN1414_c0_g1_i3.p1  ORF type:complete len:145 (+),score=5.96 TRINITY_DN1414_c0_g1_i3:107-541(+)